MFDLRRLVEQARRLSTPAVPAKQHPLGLSLPATHRLSPSEGEPALRIPKRAEGLNWLRDIVAREVLDLTDTETAAAWHHILDKPSLCVSLRAPSVTDLLAHGFPVPDGAELRIRAVALAVVLTHGGAHPPGSARLDGEEGFDVRVAGVGRLVVVADPKNAAVSLDAWTDIRWVRSARALSRELEPLYRSALPSAQQAGSRRSVTLVLGDDLADSVDASASNDIEQVLASVAAIHSYQLRILRRPRRFLGNILDVVSSTPPSLLVIASPPEPNVDSICAAYRSSATAPSVSHLGECDSTELVNDFREALAAAVGVSPGLQSRWREPVEDETLAVVRYSVPGIWPVEHPGQRQRHDRFGLYVESLQDGYWYTPDTAGHADSVIKRYRRIGRQLEHDADIAQDGKKIPKHKGEVGAVVSLDEMHGV